MTEETAGMIEIINRNKVYYYYCIISRYLGHSDSLTFKSEARIFWVVLDTEVHGSI